MNCESMNLLSILYSPLTYCCWPRRMICPPPVQHIHILLIVISSIELLIGNRKILLGCWISLSPSLSSPRFFMQHPERMTSYALLIWTLGMLAFCQNLGECAEQTPTEWAILELRFTAPLYASKLPKSFVFMRSSLMIQLCLFWLIGLDT